MAKRKSIPEGSCPSGTKRNKYGKCVKLTMVDKAKGALKKTFSQDIATAKGIGRSVEKAIWGNYGPGKKYYKQKK